MCFYVSFSNENCLPKSLSHRSVTFNRHPAGDIYDKQEYVRGFAFVYMVELLKHLCKGVVYYLILEATLQ